MPRHIEQQDLQIRKSNYVAWTRTEGREPAIVGMERDKMRANGLTLHLEKPSTTFLLATIQ